MTDEQAPHADRTFAIAVMEEIVLPFGMLERAMPKESLLFEVLTET
jgi:hypothetical protein